jgi:hypothetical protein
LVQQNDDEKISIWIEEKKKGEDANLAGLRELQKLARKILCHSEMHIRVERF